MSKANAYVGHHLPPLTYESSFSLVARLVLLNQISGEDFRRIAALSASNYKAGIGINCNETLRIFNRLGWNHDPLTSQVERLPQIRHRLFFSSRLRVCSECVSGMYHSIWHQFLELTVCPLHGGLLRDTCPICHQPLGPYSLSTAAIHGFACGHCGNNLSGKPLRMRDHFRFRNDGGRLYRAFSSCKRRLLRLGAVLNAFEAADPTFPFESVNLWWPDGLAGWQIASDIMAVRRNDMQRKPGLTWLVWPVHRRNLLREGEWRLIYSEAVWKLRSWLVHRYPACLHAGDRPELFDDGGVPRSDAWPPEVLAYMLMRYKVELASTWGLSVATDGISDEALSNLIGPSWFQTFGGEYLQGESIQASVFACFATYYWWVRSGCPSAANLVNDHLAIARWQVAREWEPSIAAVVFPSIENMPLGRFEPSPLRLTDALELARRDALLKRRMELSYRLGYTFDVRRQSFDRLRSERLRPSQIRLARAMELVRSNLLDELDQPISYRHGKRDSNK